MTAAGGPDLSLEYHIVKAIIHLTLKSTYEYVRQCRLLFPKIFFQFEADMYFLYISTVFLPAYLFSGNSSEQDYKMVYKEELHNLSGLFNEVMSSAEGRAIGY